MVDMAKNSCLTLLPPMVANMVSLVTRSCSLYLRVGTFMGRIALYGVRNSTLTGLELCRAMMENILIRAGRDVTNRTSGGLSEVEAEGLLERSLTKLHSNITNFSFAVSIGFQISSAAMDSACGVSRLLLTALDSIFGSTDSSKAIAGIIVLIRREFQNPATGRKGEKVGVADLLIGICGLALLQRWCRRMTDAEDSNSEIIWDVVVLNNGKRADVVENSGLALVKADSMIFMSTPNGHEMISPTELEERDREIQDDGLPEIMLRDRIIKALPPNTSVSVHTQTNTTKIITVIVTGAKPPNVSLPPGVEIIEEEPHHIKDIGIENDGLMVKQTAAQLTPRYRVTYRAHRETWNKLDPPRAISYSSISDAVINDDHIYSNSGLTLTHRLRVNTGYQPEKLIPKTSENGDNRSFITYPTDTLANQKRFRKPANLSLSGSPRPISLRKPTIKSPSKMAKYERLSSIETFERECWLQNSQLNDSKMALYSLISNESEPPNSSGSYYVRSKKRNSVISEPDISTSQSEFLTQFKFERLFRARSEKQIASSTLQNYSPKHHRRSKSSVPNIYAMQNNIFGTPLYLKQPRSAFSDLDGLSRTGLVADLFPQDHLIRNITRYVRFASASYGSNFLRVMGITSGESGRELDATHHYEHYSFSTHTRLSPSTILLSSFVDSQGGSDSTGNTNTGVPMVHFVSLDHDSKAVVLTCRGTLGFEDVLTDMTCDYDDLIYCGKAYKVHKGIHASARRLLDGGGGKVMATISTALLEFPDYGLVMCGHSLGGAVSALLAVMISKPNPSSTAFSTAYLPLLSANNPSFKSCYLPKDRRVHVYAYGPPATMCPSLRIATRGLITTIVNDQDLVPYLSLGLLHDLQAVALAFKADDTGAKSEVTKRVWQGITGKFSDTWNNRERMVKEEDDQWSYSTLKTLRACMLSTKLVPPGEVLVVETMPVLQRYGSIKGPLGRPATRVVLKYVKDVEKRFGELKFGGSMLLDHSPGRYESSLNALGEGVLRN